MGSPVADFLRLQKKTIAERWLHLERNGGERPAPDGVPILLERLADVVELVALPQPHGTEHALVRLDTSYAADEILREYSRLRRILVRMIAADVPAASAADLERLHAGLDDAAEAAVAAFVQQATAELHAERSRFDLALRRSVNQVQRTAEFRERVVGIVSHDLRNPLNAIVLGVQLLQKQGPRNERERNTLRRIGDAADRAVRLIRDLLDYSLARLGTGLPIHREECNLHDIIEHVVEEARLAFPDRTFLVRDGDDADGEWDRARLEQVLTNLLRNAVQHSRPATPVTLAVTATPDKVSLRVHNYGKPIPPDVLPVIFEPFQRGTATSSKDGNAGLGLYIATEIVRGHDGRIDVTSTAEQGTTFIVELPRHVARVQESSPPQ